MIENKPPLPERDEVQYRTLSESERGATVCLPEEVVSAKGLITGRWQKVGDDGRWIFIADFGEHEHSQRVYDNNSVLVPDEARDGVDGFFVWYDDELDMVVLQEAKIVQNGRDKDD